jgi:predicted RNase H-like HicB family nuclease
MTTLIYVAAVKAAGEDGYTAAFPDLPGCEAAGRDLAEVMLSARTALLARLAAIENAGEAWPAPTPIEHLHTESGTFAVPIDVAVDDPPIRVNISLGERLVQRLDAAAAARGMTRSGYIARSVRVSLGETTWTADDFAFNSRRIQDELTNLGRRINDSIGPDSPFARRMNELDERVYDGVRKAADSVSAAMSRRRDAAKGPEHGGDPTSSPSDHS